MPRQIEALTTGWLTEVLGPGAKPWIVIDRYVAAAADLDVGELIVL